MNPPTVSWPPSSSTPFNEFRYISSAFPTLFSTGAADYVALRTVTTTVSNYFKHLMMYEDGRFARHPCIATSPSTLICALQADRIYIRQHLHDPQLSVRELREVVKVRSWSLDHLDR